MEKEREALEKIQHLVMQRTGLRPDTISTKNWEKAVLTRLNVNGQETLFHYFNLLMASKVELNRLVELITNPETWFFRDASAIWFVAKEIQEKSESGTKSTTPLLIIPSSTGEEPYSIILALNSLNVKTSAYRIEGIDISSQLIERAIEGIYNKNSFRNDEARQFIKGSFIFHDKGYQLAETLRRQVHFHQGNALDRPWQGKQNYYQFIFCRNMLIYLTPEAQRQILSSLSEALTTNGLLFLGPSEVELAVDSGFFTLSNSKPTALMKKSKASPNERSMENQLEPTNGYSSSRASQSPPDGRSLLLIAKELADSGQFQNALRKCHESLDVGPIEPEAYYLLGVIHHAQGDYSLAEAYFQKVLDLKPYHYEALIYLSLLMQKKGLTQRADMLRKRAEQCLPHSSLST